MKDFIKKTFEKYNFNLTENQINQFEKYFNFLVQENEKYNLTGITKMEEVVVKHFIDSVLPIKNFRQNATIIDVGTGAGFPGVPLKILRPDLKITLLDSLQKRINFLNQLIKFLNLENIFPLHFRAEEYISKTREKFDYAVSRAVAPLPTLCEYLIPYVKIGGEIIMYKGANLDEEMSSQKAIKTLGTKIERVEKYILQEENSERKILILKKVSQTPSKYPRGKNEPRKNPII